MRKFILGLFCLSLMSPMVTLAAPLPFIPHDDVETERPDQLSIEAKRVEDKVIQVMIDEFKLVGDEEFFVECGEYAGGDIDYSDINTTEREVELVVVDAQAIYWCYGAVKDGGAMTRHSENSFSRPIVDDVSLAEVENPFSDVNVDVWQGKAAVDLYYLGIVRGYDDGKFHGERMVNRAEAAKFLLLAYAQKNEIQNGELPKVDFSDVELSAWYYRVVIDAMNIGMMQGYDDGTFRPGNTVNTAEFLKMLAKAFSLEEGLSYDYEDVNEGDWFAKYAGAAQRYDLFPRRTNELMPAAALTRDEIAVAIHRLLSLQN